MKKDITCRYPGRRHYRAVHTRRCMAIHRAWQRAVKTECSPALAKDEHEDYVRESASGGTKTTPVIWRGPVIAGVVTQFWTDVMWGDLDYLFVDMPPGTGDVPLTVFQSLPVDGVVIVTSPQDLVQMIVKKAYNMAETNEYSGTGNRRELQLFKMSGLRQGDQYLRREPHR